MLDDNNDLHPLETILRTEYVTYLWVLGGGLLFWVMWQNAILVFWDAKHCIFTGSKFSQRTPKF